MMFTNNLTAGNRSDAEKAQLGGLEIYADSSTGLPQAIIPARDAKLGLGTENPQCRSANRFPVSPLKQRVDKRCDRQSFARKRLSRQIQIEPVALALTTTIYCSKRIQRVHLKDAGTIH